MIRREETTTTHRLIIAGLHLSVVQFFASHDADPKSIVSTNEMVVFYPSPNGKLVALQTNEDPARIIIVDGKGKIRSKLDLD